MAASRSSFRAPNINVAEAIAAYRGCFLAKQQGLNDIVLESDSTDTILCLQNSIENGSWEALHTLRKILNAKEWFHSCRWS